MKNQKIKPGVVVSFKAHPLAKLGGKKMRGAVKKIITFRKRKYFVIITPSGRFTKRTTAVTVISPKK